MVAVVVDLAQYRAAVRPAVSQACRRHAAFEELVQAQMRLCFSWQRVLLRTCWGV